MNLQLLSALFGNCEPRCSRGQTDAIFSVEEPGDSESNCERTASDKKINHDEILRWIRKELSE